MQQDNSASHTPSIQTTCAYCGVGCGITANIINKDQRLITVSGDTQHPSNFGRLCSKGTALADTIGISGRLLSPMIRGQKTSWDSAIQEVADGFNKVIAEHGPDAVAFYVSGQLLTEDYYVANKLMKGYIGSANIDTNSRLCMASPTIAHKRAFGEDIVPVSYEDVEAAQLIVLVGSNTAWCHPVLFQRIRKAKEDNPKLKVVVIDPRKTDTCDIADLHLPVQSGTDGALFNGLLSYLVQHGHVDFKWLEAHTEGFGDAIAAAQASAPNIPSVSRECGIAEKDIAEFYRLFAANKQTVTLFSQGVNQSTSGSDKCNSIINVHLLTGRIGKEGAGPFSMTGQPNAMGGREVGGLANQLAAHMDFDPTDTDLVRRFWQSPTIARKPGYKAVELFDRIEKGEVKAVWIIATNPVDSLPNADQVKQALSKCDLVVYSDCIGQTDTAAYADILLPAQGWGEKDGTVTNSERRISRQRAIFPAPGDTKADWWIICEVAKAMGFGEGFQFTSAHEIFLEHAALSAFENTPDKRPRIFNLSGISKLSEGEYNRLDPIQWPVLNTPSANNAAATRVFSDGRFNTPSGKARFVTTVPQKPANALSDEYPLILNTGRVRDQWHTMTRTALAPQLNTHKVEPYLEIHPADAKRFALEDGGIAKVRSAYGEMYARVEFSEQQKFGHVFVPMHWTEQYAINGRVNVVVNPAVDPLSGQPESKHTPVTVEPCCPAWHGFLLSRRRLKVDGAEYVVRVSGARYFRYELAGSQPIAEASNWVRNILCDNQKDATEWMEYFDKKQQKYRGARFLGDNLESCIFISPARDLPSRSWLTDLFDKPCISDAERLSLLAGKPPAGHVDKGRTVCACFAVGENTIKQLIKQKSLTSVAAVGECCNAGTNCGSCIPEIQKLLP